MRAPSSRPFFLAVRSYEIRCDLEVEELLEAQIGQVVLAPVAAIHEWSEEQKRGGPRGKESRGSAMGEWGYSLSLSEKPGTRPDGSGRGTRGGFPFPGDLWA